MPLWRVAREGGVETTCPTHACAQAYARSTQLAVNAGVALYNSSIGLFATPKKYREKHQVIEIASTIKLLCSLLGHQVATAAVPSCSSLLSLD